MKLLTLSVAIILISGTVVDLGKAEERETCVAGTCIRTHVLDRSGEHHGFAQDNGCHDVTFSERRNDGAVRTRRIHHCD